ncbi:hypothetical protein E2C01_097801 [Portunus trituberculatus]|uniref:Uncharacterized protein n=1 Tax=Portunus trituberculatus TaxID=210409 RepID=A0A5B7JW52_PORTR|nr:hypothetical protein [Portunus trituberculatus]
MPRTERMSFSRCVVVAASPRLEVRRVLLSIGRRWCLARGSHVAMSTFPSDGWRKAASGE